MIWIDKECLTQVDTDEYHRLGVQTMDIVYNRVMVTGAILDATVKSQVQIDVVDKLSEDRPQRDTLLNPDVLFSVLELIQSLNEDNWYKRAWIIQEALSAGNPLVLALRCPSGLQYGFRPALSEAHPRSPYKNSVRMEP